uniref:MRH domain-containing protein n=1 Tax=Arion vulgaris TaxID=1028688 RepID=A0A0B6ZTC1_9EUPU
MALVTHLLIVSSHDNNHVTFRLLGLLILFAISFSVHNKQVLAATDTDMCQFSKYASESQDSLNEAKKRLASLAGKKYESNDGVEWKYTVGICSSVGGTDGNAAVLQTKMVDGQATEGHNIGSLKDTHILVGTDWIFLEYKQGESYGTHCNNESKRSVIMITCDATVDDSSAEMVFMREEKNKAEQCYYLFEMKHQAVCPTISNDGSLSVGSILLIVFASVATVYLVVGFLYSRFVLRAKGIEQIPNYEFWKDFGNLQSDGCDFLCRSKGRRRLNDFGGIGDDQLDPVEDIQDDNLLPM